MATHETALAGPTRPLGSPDIPQFYLPLPGKGGVYTPYLYGAAMIRFGNKKRKIDEARRVAVLLKLDATTKTVDWESATPVEIGPDQLLKVPPTQDPYLPLPAGAMDTKVFTRWAKAFDRWLARTQRLDVTPQADMPDVTSIGPKRGGVSVDLVAIAWRID
ncbi:MAG: hypothetical protein ABI634_10980 [Acidobacteriota bacterium]